ncbi:gluconokinase [Providencia sp. wls1943]|uniref:gluconokinase n=1 Tax=Providencia sp. wls1943 TaxID=2675150 RepID=UPI0012B665CE|nr:gluconokinase [Providencia sp. wls1943]MTB66145.1 gluconokinase [Providencia sp. wls1943]
MSDTQNQNYTFVLMGVSGSGKSAVASGVAQQLQAAFLDGDFLHPKSNIMKMASGQALNDDDRRPWLEALNGAIFAMQRTNQVSLVVCSALKKSYRDILREDNKNLYFIYLKGDAAVIEERLRARRGHFFKPEMLKSQFDTLQEPDTQEADAYAIDIRPALNEVIDNTCATIRQIMTGDKA